MEYPRFVFISPGAQKCNGGTYDHEIVKNEKEHKAALDAGFSDSVPEALESSKLVKADMMAEDKPKRGRKPKENIVTVEDGVNTTPRVGKTTDFRDASLKEAEDVQG